MGRCFAASNAVGPIAKALDDGNIDRARAIIKMIALQHDGLVETIQKGEWPMTDYVNVTDFRLFAEKFNLGK